MWVAAAKRNCYHFCSSNLAPPTKYIMYKRWWKAMYLLICLFLNPPSPLVWGLSPPVKVRATHPPHGAYSVWGIQCMGHPLPCIPPPPHPHPSEYAYGGHPYSYTGVYSMQPKQVDGISTDGGVRFKESVRIGYTTVPESEVAQLIQSLGVHYNGNTYNVFHK